MYLSYRFYIGFIDTGVPVGTTELIPTERILILPIRENDSCHGRVSGINKICFLYSSYCRSEATAA